MSTLVINTQRYHAELRRSQFVTSDQAEALTTALEAAQSESEWVTKDFLRAELSQLTNRLFIAGSLAVAAVMGVMAKGFHWL